MANEENGQVQEPAQDDGPNSADEIPKDRVFCTVYLYLTEDNEIAGGVDYKGTVLEQLKAAPLLGGECLVAAKLMGRYARQAIDQAAREAELMAKLIDVFNLTEEDLEQSDDDSDGEQAGAASAQ